MANLDAIKQAEAALENGRVQLVSAISSTFTAGTKVFVKGPRGEKETAVTRTEGEDLYLATSKGEMKRHYATVRLV